MRNPPRYRFGSLVGTAPASQRLFEQLGRIAGTDTTVLLEGETGTGKRHVAQEIVRHGARAAQPVVLLDCDEAPAHVEQALFGDDGGGVTDPPEEAGGALVLAHGGTLILREVA